MTNEFGNSTSIQENTGDTLNNDLPRLLLTRDRFIGTISRHRDFANSIVPEHQGGNLMMRLRNLEETWNNFIEVDDEITLISERSMSMYATQEEIYFDARARFEAEISARIPPQLASNSTAQDTQEDLNATMSRFVSQQQTLIETLTQTRAERSSDLRLPRLNIPSFSGQYQDWPAFKDIFLNAVDRNLSLSDIQKFQYLKGVLTKDAAALIRHMLVTSDNYRHAWDKLTDRYDRKKHVLSSYIKTFCDQPTISKLTASYLRKLTDTSDEIIRALEALGPDANSRDPWLNYIVLSKLDPDTKQLWSEKSAGMDMPSFQDLLKFLNTRCDSLETTSASVIRRSGHTERTVAANSFHGQQSSHTPCPCCSRPGHPMYKCFKFKSFSATNRRKFVRDRQLCYNCLKPDHSVSDCDVEKVCSKCNMRHHTLVHLDSKSHDPLGSSREQSLSFDEKVTSSGAAPIAESHVFIKSKPKDNPFKEKTPQSFVSLGETSTDIASASTLCSENSRLMTLLPTALVYVLDVLGTPHLCRILLDSGSQTTLVSESCVQRLRLSRQNARISITGISASSAGSTKGKVYIILRSRFDPQREIKISALILSRLTANVPAQASPKMDWSYLKFVPLADPHFDRPRGVDILLGADYFMSVLESGKILGPNGMPAAQNTIFGWVLLGSLPTSSNSDAKVLSCHHIDMDLSLRKFWEAEEPPSHENTLTTEEQFAEDHFKNHVKFQPDGRFIVHLPFYSDDRPLGNSFQAALSRFKSMERKFSTNPEFYRQYREFMLEYEGLKHMELVPNVKIGGPDGSSFYLPHHAVLRESSSTTKLRVVFDGSCRSSSGISLNETLAVGPTIQPDLLTILLNFRRHKVVFTADVEKMYRQVLVSEKDRDFQRIIWRDSPKEPLKHYRLRTVTYGTAPAPFLATRCLHEIGEQIRLESPLASYTIQNHFYVDDLISGADSVDDALSLCRTVSVALQSHGFVLRKWTSNSTDFLKNVPPHQTGQKEFDIGETPESFKILGLHWQPNDDVFSFRVQLFGSCPDTKRRILSESSRLFDPLGLLSPCIIMVKIMFQKLWLEGHDWDDVLSGNSIFVWNKLRGQLPLLENVKVSRSLYFSCNIELHGFSDASESAYAAVIYSRVVDQDGRTKTNIIISKSRVAPLKQVSLPRLELCAAHLLVKLFKFVKDKFDVADKNCFAYTDSMIVLSWLSGHPRKWKCYVANRTTEILSIIPRSQWHHVKSKENPADLASRGILPCQLIISQLWWHGPEWLQNDSTNRSNYVNSVDIPDTDEEIKKSEIEILYSNNNCNYESNPLLCHLFTNHSSYFSVLRLICWLLRFISKSKSTVQKRKQNKTDNNADHVIIKNHISSDEIGKAHDICIRWIQAAAYKTEINQLQTKGSIQRGSQLLSLHPFIDSKIIMRVGGRLENSSCSFETKHPIILPRESIFTIRLIKYLHLKHFHAGPTLLTSIIRQNYWIPGVRNVVKKTVHECIQCFRYKNKVSTQLMADLPKWRTESSKPFSHSGVDYAGPFKIRTHSGRSYQVKKSYIALFVCFSTKAIHVELVADLSSASFIAALKRFAARRNVPSDIYSDNGTNFVGAFRKLNADFDEALKGVFNQQISAHLAEARINWHFIPPFAPHFGGLWEAGVKTVKGHLKKILSERLLTLDEMNTVLCQVEALVNSRPLCQANSAADDPSYYDALTPAHFLVGKPLASIPEPSYLNLSTLNHRWNQLQKLKQDFWKRWSRDYLTTLQNRPKWCRITKNLSPNDLVIVKEINIPPSIWPLGRIVDVHPGEDGLVRTATVKTKNGLFTRPITRICRLPDEKS